jgi:pyridoxine 4-dehydrogenase
MWSIMRTARVDTIDLYYLHRPDPKVPFQTQAESWEQLRSDGLIASIGLSNVSLEQWEFAVSVAPIAAVQNEFSASHKIDGARSVWPTGLIRWVRPTPHFPK